MKRSLILGICLFYSFSSFAALTCKQIESKQDSDGNFSYFTEVENLKINSAVTAKLFRLAVADFYGKCGVTWNEDYCYREEMTDAEVDELGEGVYFHAYKTPSKKLYYGINVGFGGGNSATYYFSPKELKMEKVMVVDGADCGPIQSILGYN